MTRRIRIHGLIAATALLMLLAAAATPAAEPQPDPAAFARGARAWAAQCARCHNMRAPRELRDDQWRAVVTHMRVRAGLTGQQTRDILRFLQESN
jgi:mono/diheme cytochrome c family protein